MSSETVGGTAVITNVSVGRVVTAAGPNASSSRGGGD